MTSKWHKIEEREGRSMEDILIELYEKHGHEPKAQQIIADELGVSQPTVSQWIKFLRLVPKTTLRHSDARSEGGDCQSVN